MGLIEKVIIALVITALTQIAYRHCMPSISRKASLKRYLDNLKPVKNNPSPTSFTPSRVNKLTKQTYRKRSQNGRVNNNSVPQKSLYDTYNFPHNDYPLDNSPRDPFRFGNLNANHKVNTQRRAPNPQSSAINDLKKDMKRKRKLLSNIQSNDANNLSENKTPLMKIASGSDSTRLVDQGTFPEVQYPLTTMETWEPKYWNCLPFDQDEKQFNSFQRDTFKPKVKNNKQLTRLTKTKENKFLKSYEVLKGKQQRTSTENSKRSSTGEQGLNFTKTATCEKVTDEFISAGLVSMLPKNASVSKTTLERDNITKMENKCEITEYSLDSQLDANKKVDDLENSLPLELNNNTDESKELINIINEILKLESIEDETETTESASNFITEKSTDKLDTAINNSTNEDIPPTSIDDTSSYKDANAPEELLRTKMTYNELADEMSNTTLPLSAEPERDNITCVEDTSNVTLPLSIPQSVTTKESLTNTSSSNPTEVPLLSNGNAAPGPTSIIIIPINNNVVGKSQSHIITGTQDKPIILYIPTQSSDIHTHNFLSEQQISLSLEKFMQDNHLGNNFANMTSLQNLSSNDLVSEILNCNSHNGSSLPMNETLTINSMCYNNESNLTSIAVIESASLEPDNNEKIHTQPEDLNSEILSGETLPQTPDFKHPLLDFPGNEFTLLSHGPFNDNLSSELPIIAREIILDQEISPVPAEDLYIEKHNVTSETFLKNGDIRSFEETLDEDSVTPLTKTYIDGKNFKSDKYVLPASHADDTEIIKEVPLLPEIEQYSMPVPNDKLTSSSSEEPANIIEPSPDALFKPAEVSVPPAIPFDSTPVDLSEIMTTQLPLTQGSHETTNNAQQPMEKLASLPSSSNNVPMTTDTKLESALLPEFQKISLLLDKMLSRFETFTTNSKIAPVSEDSSSPQPLTISQVPIDSLPLPVDITIKSLEGTETVFESLVPSLSGPIPPNPPIDSLKYSLPISLDEPNDPYSLLKPSTVPTQPTAKKIVVITPIKELEPISQISSDSISLPVDNMFKAEAVVESPLKTLQEINQPLSPSPESKSWSFPSNSLVKPSDSPSKTSYEILSAISDSNNFQSQIKHAEGSQVPFSETFINTIEQRTNQLLQTPENLCLPINKTFEFEVAETPLESPELKIDKYCPINSLRIQTQSEPNNLLHTTADSYTVLPASKETQLISQKTDSQCLPLNITSPTFLGSETSIQSLQQQADKPVPSTLINDAPTNDRCPLNYTSFSSYSVLETDNTPLDEKCPLTPLTQTSETPIDYKKSDNDNLISVLSLSGTVKSTKASHFYGSIEESSDVPLKMDLLIPDIFEDSKDDLPFVVNTEPTINNRTTTENTSIELPESNTFIPELPVCEQSNATDTLSAKIALDNVTSDEGKYNLPENNLILGGLTQEALSNDDSPLITNDTIIEIPNSDDIQQDLPRIEHLLPLEDKKPSQRNKPYSTSTIVLTKALLESLLSEIEKREFSTPDSAVFPVKPAKLIDQTEEVEPSPTGMTYTKFPEESSSKEEETQSDLDLSTNLSDYHQMSESEDLLTFPMDNTYSEIKNLESYEDNTPQVDETHKSESDKTTGEVFHKELDIPPTSDNIAFQSPTTADFTSPEDDKPDIPLTRDRTSSRSRLLLTKAILENVLSDLSQKNTALPAKATRVTSLSVSDKTANIDPTNSDDPSKTDKYEIPIKTTAAIPRIDNFQSSNNTYDVLAVLNETLSEIPSFNRSPVLPSQVETDLENNDKLHNSDDLSISSNTYNSGMNDMVDKSSDSPPSLLPTSEVQNVLPDEMTEYSLPGDKFLSISSTPDKAQVIDILDERPSQLSVDKNPSKNSVTSEQPTDKVISENPEDITLPVLDETILVIPDNQQDDKQNINENVLFENSTDDFTLSNGHALPVPNEKVVKRGPSITNLRITKALLESVLSDLNARIYSSPIATTHLDKMRYNISPSLNTANNPSQILLDMKPENEQSQTTSEEVEMISDGILDSEMLEDKYDSDDNMSNPSSDLSSSNGYTLHSDEKVDKVSPSASKLLITKALLKNVLSDINTRGFSLLSKDLPKKSVLDKTLYFIEPPLSEVIDETTSSPVDEDYHDYEPDTETYYVLTLPADNSEFDMSRDDSPMDKKNNEIIKARAEDEAVKIEDLASDTEYNSSQEMGENLSLADDYYTKHRKLNRI